jgi:uncharacterized protein YdaU (DUF1376 family)
MSRAGAIPYFGDAYMADTRHLTLEEHGAYHLLMLIAWRSPNCALPDDDKRLAQMLGITGKKWASLRPSVMAFWTLTENGWEQRRLTKERRWVEEKSRKNKSAAEARWEDKSLKDNGGDDANASANGQANADANGDAPPPPPTKKSSEDKSSGGEPPDPLKELFDVGVSVLTAAGHSERQARSLIGKWRKHGEEQVLTALIACKTKSISNPVEWITKSLNGSSGYVSDSGYQYRGSEEQVLRQAEARADWNTYWSIKKKAAVHAQA